MEREEEEQREEKESPISRPSCFLSRPGGAGGVGGDGFQAKRINHRCTIEK